MSDYAGNSSVQRQFDPVWPQRFRPFLFALGAIPAWLTVTVLAWGAGEDHSTSMIDSLFIAAVVMLPAAHMFHMAGFQRIGLHPGIRHCHDDTHGRGIEIPYQRLLYAHAAFWLSFFTVIVAIGIRSADERRGMNELSDPHPPDGSFWMWTTLAVVLAGALPFLLRPRGGLYLYTEGIQRRTSWLYRRAVSDVFVRWEDIEQIVPDVYTVTSRGAEIHHPLMRFRVPGFRVTRPRVPHDQPGAFTVMAYVLVSEPNALVGLIDRLHRCPEDRHLVTTPEAPELLRPLPVRERLRIARKIPRQQWEW
ncbi:hypothetical protein MX572_20155 [Rhodococcus pyridinivorans]|uniref:hypothetical protein n=1 Tax=Rhodococcus TaxID=1827 RepID=UPI000A9596DE|nr:MULTISPECIES: hypothetical protein [Rhodococcus]UTM36786.1 hypothetical protein MX572_20155 [Rhodococcus pyridinivorans]